MRDHELLEAALEAVRRYYLDGGLSATGTYDGLQTIRVLLDRMQAALGVMPSMGGSDDRN